MNNTELKHHGVKGMRWGRRKALVKTGSQKTSKLNSDNSTKTDARTQKVKTAVKIGVAVTATCLAAYGAKKLHDFVRSTNVRYRNAQGNKAAAAFLEKYKDAMMSKSMINSRVEEIRRGWSNQASADSFGRAIANAYKYIKSK